MSASLRMRFTLTLLVALCLARTSSAGSLTDAEVAKTLNEVARLRDLPVLGKIDIEVVSKETIRSLLVAQLADDYPDGKIAKLEKGLRFFGLLPGDFDLEAYYLESSTNEIAGYYDYRKGKLYLADWVGGSGYEETLSHELVHALQDQHFNLGLFLGDVHGQSEAHLARSALIEGAAVAMTFDYALRERGLSFTQLGDVSQVIEQKFNAINDANPRLADAPGFLAEAAFFPYVYGLRFIYAVRSQHPWSWLETVYLDPPSSSEQIMHPEKYLDRRDDPIPVGPSYLPTLDGWVALDSEEAGELGVRNILRRYIDGDTAASAAAGWGGDRYELFEAPGGETAVVWATVWDSPCDAFEFFAAYRLTTREKDSVGRPLLSASKLTFRYGTRARETRIELRGARVYVIEGFTRRQTQDIVDTLTN